MLPPKSGIEANNRLGKLGFLDNRQFHTWGHGSDAAVGTPPMTPPANSPGRPSQALDAYVDAMCSVAYVRSTYWSRVFQARRSTNPH